MKQGRTGQPRLLNLEIIFSLNMKKAHLTSRLPSFKNVEVELQEVPGQTLRVARSQNFSSLVTRGGYTCEKQMNVQTLIPYAFLVR